MNPITQHGYVSMQQAVRDLIRGIINFRGRATRRGYLPAFIYYVVVIFVALMALGIAVISSLTNDANMALMQLIIVAILQVVAKLALMAVTVRRFRDAGFRTWVILILLLLSGLLVYFVALVLPTDCMLRYREMPVVRLIVRDKG
ncbi:DUF805 domain-containing protein [Ligilactobacillus sp. LYQ60]|uniref:DUF805 domain-containing protein n=1 Tax=Ligilactobacillus sp. LYQ60 TaxID=3378799 RepID=UPI00385455C6